MRARWLLLVGVGLVSVAGAGCGEGEKPPPKVARETAGTQIKRVAERWGDAIEEEGFLGHDPSGVTRYRVVTKRTLTFGQGDAATVRIERDEMFETSLATYQCQAKGELHGKARFAWVVGEAEARVQLPAGQLPRTCKPAGFPVTAKALQAETMVLLLRSDRLIGRASGHDHTVLLPLP
ncbi:MAG: hypothetical protein R3B70_14010 [Polyangiaceae bacterium]